jgi:hypothetical protein
LEGHQTETGFGEKQRDDDPMRWFSLSSLGIVEFIVGMGVYIIRDIFSGALTMLQTSTSREPE